jgi:hypothetical protein
MLAGFRLLFLGPAAGTRASILQEAEFRAAGASAAIEGIANVGWPAGAIGLRLVDADGHTVYELSRSDQTRARQNWGSDSRTSALRNANGAGA